MVVAGEGGAFVLVLVLVLVLGPRPSALEVLNSRRLVSTKELR